MKNWIIISLILRVLLINSFAQNTVDSLFNVWKDVTYSDSNRVNAISKLIWKNFLFTKPDTALVLANEYLLFAQERYLNKNRAEALNIMGVASSLRGDTKKAAQYYLEGLAIGEEIQDKFGIASSLNNLGMLFGKTGDYQQAIYYLKKNIEINEEIGDRKITSALNNLGMVYTKMGEFSNALLYLKRALQLKEFYNDNAGTASTLLNIGNVYAAQGNYNLANYYFQRCAQLNESLNDQLGYGAVMMSIGTNYRNSNQYEEAIACFLKSQTIQESIGDKKGLGSSYNNLGVCYKDMGKYEQSLDYYFKSLKIKEGLNDKQGISNSWGNIATVYFEMKDYALATDYAQKANDLALKINASAQIKSSLRLLYQIHIACSSHDKAYFYLKQLIDLRSKEIQLNYFTLSENDKVKYLSTLSIDFGLLYDFALFQMNGTSEITEMACNLALKTKGLTLRSTSTMRNSIQESNDSILIDRYEQWISLKSNILKEYESGKNIQSLQHQADELEEELMIKSPIFKEIKNEQNVDWKNIQKALTKNELVVEFVNFKSEISPGKPGFYGAFLFKKESETPLFIPICKEDELERIIDQFKGDNARYTNKLYSQSSDLYKLLWLPIEKYTNKIQTIHISPTGLLHKISFSGLMLPNSKYLCELFDIQLYNSTLKLAGKKTESVMSNEVFMIYGGIEYDTDQTKHSTWNYLEGTLNESEKISSFIKENNYKLIYAKGLDANENHFKLNSPKASIIHLATHGFFFPDPEKLREDLKKTMFIQDDVLFRGLNDTLINNNDSISYAYWNFVKNSNPMMRSGVVLAGGNEVWHKKMHYEEEDGVLTAIEVSNIDLRKTKLIVLSACETGLGDINGNEGVFGLQRAFKTAGAQNLIMSLWQVPDKATAEFMELFYKNLIRIKDISVAFRKAQLTMCKKYEPFYWAAFVLMN
jgi:CHAT domain-containing protein